MRVRFLGILLLLTPVALPAWSAASAASPEPTPQISLTDILAPAPASLATSAFPDIFQAAACFPSCTSNAQCQSLCCATAVCTFSSSCQKKVCNCTVCP
ncbi:MAG: hypothetical protein QOH06_3837 [Acidobacteriota bacterium]|nr:hypothetical protein [Acidobacteriota bacterium]